jgi:predicted nucleotidyltransferase
MYLTHKDGVIMKVTGIVVEYNPLHHGHMHHLEKARAMNKDGVLIAVMSAHAMQRGEFSITDKFTRTKWALNAGIDLVIELPAVFSLQNADIFAQTSVEILDLLKADTMVFGSETGDIKHLKKVVATMNTKTYQDKVKLFMDEGNSYPTSSQRALNDIHDSTFKQAPNDILGIQYIQAIDSLESTIEPHAIERVNAGYYDGILASSKIQSATAIRACHFNDEPYEAYVPSFVYKDLSHTPKLTIDAWFPFMSYKLASETPEQLGEVFGFEEGLEYLFVKHYDASCLDDFLDRVSSKRYTHAKIKRALMSMLLGIKKDDIANFKVPYIRVLGMNKKGQQHLNTVKHDLEDKDIPLITKLKQSRHPFLDIELTVTKVYDLIIQRDLMSKEFAPVIIW